MRSSVILKSMRITAEIWVWLLALIATGIVLWCTYSETANQHAAKPETARATKIAVIQDDHVRPVITVTPAGHILSSEITRDGRVRCYYGNIDSGDLDVRYIGRGEGGSPAAVALQWLCDCWRASADRNAAAAAGTVSGEPKPNSSMRF